MENNTALDNISKELVKLSEKINDLRSSEKGVSEKGLQLIEEQLKNAQRTLEIFMELKYGREVIPVAEETIPVDMKEVVGLSLENTAAEAVKKPEPAIIAVTEKTITVKEVMPASTQEKTDASLVEKMKLKPIQDLKSAIDINEKFAFIKLFGGNPNLWNEAVQKLNSSSADEARNLLAEFSKKHNWKQDDEAVQSLMALVKRRHL